MDGSEKEAVQWVRDAFGEGLSRAEVTRKLQNQGFKLEYIDSLISKARRPRRIFLGLLIFIGIVLVCCLAFASYIYFSPVKMENLENPLAGKNYSSQVFENITEEFSISPEAVSYLLNSIGAWKLKTSPIGMDKPVIISQIGDDFFYSVIYSGKIKTYEGTVEGADIKIITTEKVVFDSLVSKDSIDVFRSSFVSGESQLEMLADEKTLFLKGYLSLYESLS